MKSQMPSVASLFVAVCLCAWMLPGCGSSASDADHSEPVAQAESSPSEAQPSSAAAPSNAKPADTKPAETQPADTKPDGSTPAKADAAGTEAPAKTDAAAGSDVAVEASGPPATVEDAIRVLDLRTFPVMEGATTPGGSRRQVGTLMYEAPATIQEAFDFQRREFEKLGWKLLPGGRLDGENPGADFTRQGYIVSVSVSGHGPTEGHANVWIRNTGNVRVAGLPVPEGAESYYPDRTRASYISTADSKATAQAVWKMLLDQGWKPYGAAGDMRIFKQNAILLSANVMSHPAQPGKTFITYSTEVLSADLPVSTDVADPRYTDSMKTLHYDQPGDVVDQTVEYYNRELEKSGYKATTTEPIVDGRTSSMIYRNDARDMITLDVQRYNDLTRVDVEHLSAAEVDELDRQAREAVAERERPAAEPEPDAVAKIELPVPANARNVTQDDPDSLNLMLAPGMGRGVLEAYRAYLQKQGWEIVNFTNEKEFGDLTVSKGDLRLNINFSDFGLGDDAEIEAWAMNGVLAPKKGVEGFADGAAAAPAAAPAELVVGGRVPAGSFPIPDGAADVERHADTEMVIFRSSLPPTKLAEFYRDKFKQLGWKEDPDETFVDDDLGAGGISFYTDENELRVIFQDGQPESKTRILVMGDGIAWSGAATEPSPDFEAAPVERQPAGPFLAGAGTGEGKISYDGEDFQMKYAVAAEHKEDGELKTRVLLCAQPFADGAATKIGDPDTSLFDLLADDFPACLDMHLSDGYASISFLAEGTSVNLGSSNIKSTVKRNGMKLQGRVYLEEPEDFFDKPFQFDVKVDIELKEGSTAAEVPADGALSLDSRFELPVPRNCEDVMREGTPYLTKVTASIRTDMATAMKFYREQLADQGWTEVPETAKETDDTVLFRLKGEQGPVDVSLFHRGAKIRITLTQRDDKLAAEHGVVPPKGKSMMLMGNATESAVVLTIDGKEHRLAAGLGADDPLKAMKVTIEPGKHTIGVKGGESEMIEVPAGGTWGVLVIPGGGLFSDQVY